MMDDLISRQAALDIVFDFAEAPHNMYQKIRELPTIEPKKGKWETKPFIDPNDPMKDTGAVWCRCSECKKKLGVFQDGNFFDYCPNCGAKMERSE